MPTPLKQSSFRLPQRTLDQIAALRMDLDQTATEVVCVAVQQLFDREIGPMSERDLYAELDELKRRLDELAPETPAEGERT